MRRRYVNRVVHSVAQAGNVQGGRAGHGAMYIQTEE
jgi:hypothetical protein